MRAIPKVEMDCAYYERHLDLVAPANRRDHIFFKKMTVDQFLNLL
jgi:hypothetical protein